MAPIPPKPIKQAHHLYLDIETIPSQDKRIRDYIADTVKPPGNMKKTETIAEWEKTEKKAAIEKALEQTSFDGAFNQIVCIGAAANDSDPVTFMGEEKDILQNFFDWLAPRRIAGTVYVGHNIIGFDLKIIRHRSIVLGIKPPYLPFDAKPWEKNPYCTMTQWDARNPISLDKLAMAFGIRGKSKTGADVYPMWKAQMFDDIAEYCADDVELTRKVFKRMAFVD